MTTLTAVWFDKGESDESWLRAFEAYGHAMASAAALELQLGLFILKKRALDIKHGKAEPMSASDGAAFAEATQRKTFPKLVSAIRRSFKLSDELIEALNIAKQGRNYLAHEFWKVNIGFIQTQAGVEIIAQQCLLEAWHYKQISKDLEREIGFEVDDFTKQSRASASQKHDEFASLLAKYL
jgi:hypothetical protein